MLISSTGINFFKRSFVRLLGVFLLYKGGEFIPARLQHEDVLIYDVKHSALNIRRGSELVYLNVKEGEPSCTLPMDFPTFRSFCFLLGYACGLQVNPQNCGDTEFHCTLTGAAGEQKGLFQNGDRIQLAKTEKHLCCIRDGALMRVQNNHINLPMDIRGVDVRTVGTLMGNACGLAISNSTIGLFSSCSLVTASSLTDAA